MLLSVNLSRAGLARASTVVFLSVNFRLSAGLSRTSTLVFLSVNFGVSAGLA